MQIFRPKVNQEPFGDRFKRKWELTIKCLLLLLKPTALAGVIAWAWYVGLYKHGLNAGPEETEILLVYVMVPAFMYAVLLANPAVEGPLMKYSTMRIAVKCYDIDTFMNYCDEGLSALIHMIMGLLAALCLGGFLILYYPSARFGAAIIFGVAFPFALMYFSVREMDNPNSGIWFITGIYPEWRDLKPKQYREARIAALRQAFLEKKKSGSLFLPHPAESRTTQEEQGEDHHSSALALR